MAKATNRAPGGACPTAPLHRGVYKDRTWWRVGNHGPRFSSYGAAVAHLEAAAGKSADQLLRARRATASQRNRWAATVYRGVLQRGTSQRRSPLVWILAAALVVALGALGYLLSQ
jgi:hypothetical protein